jgi:hypothetical protein
LNRFCRFELRFFFALLIFQISTTVQRENAQHVGALQQPKVSTNNEDDALGMKSGHTSAKCESADHSEIERIISSRRFSCAEELIEAAFLAATLDGMYLEFGVCTERTINAIVANLTHPNFYPFDSFRLEPHEWRARRGRKVAFLHVDCGLYDEVQKVLATLRAAIGPGTVIVFAEYRSFGTSSQNDCRAWQEFASRIGRTYTYLGFVSLGHEVAIKVLT